MNKYLSLFKISFEQEFVYRLNFIMWRVRNVMQIFLIFFLWDAVFQDPKRIVFGYDRARILTYVFAIFIIRAVVFSSRAVDVAGDISRGDLSNYLLKPISYFKKLLTRDLSSKFLNLLFASVEFSILFYLLKPPFFFQSNLIYLGGFLLALVLAILLFFLLLFITMSVPFWAPELAWGTQFLIIVVIAEFLSGAIFPLDVLPQSLQNFLYLTPFPYLVFSPIQLYLGQFEGGQVLKALFVPVFWVLVLWLVLNYIWQKGLKAYRAEGR